MCKKIVQQAARTFAQARKVKKSQENLTPRQRSKEREIQQALTEKNDQNSTKNTLKKLDELKLPDPASFCNFYMYNMLVFDYHQAILNSNVHRTPVVA